MNEFLKYLKMIPVIIYPYIYVLILAVFLLFVGVLPEDTTDISLLVLLIIAVIYNLYSFVIVIVNAVQTAKGKLTAGQAARMNLIIKGIQIPAYIMHFILGFIGLAMSVWGIGFLLWAVLIDLLTILLTGISSIGCSIRMRKEKACLPAGCHLHGDRMFYLLCGCGDRHCVCCESPEEISC